MTINVDVGGPQMPPTPRPPFEDLGRQIDNPTRNAMRQLLSWLPETLFNVYYSAWIRNNRDAELAIQEMRNSPEYDTYFGGNRREDGTLRWSETEYLQITDRFATDLDHIGGVNPELFRHKFAGMIEAGKSPDEFRSQLQAVVDRVLLDQESVIDMYSRFWGIEATPEGLIAMALDADMNDLVLNRQITMAEIASEGAQRSFSIDKEFAATLFNANLDEESAAQFFGDAGAWVPVLNVLARRHADPDDDFDLEDFSASELFQDRGQRQRMRRLVSQERSAFTQPGTFGVRTTEETGGFAGLAPR